MIRIHLVGGDTVDTRRWTYEQAETARANGGTIEVGGTWDTEDGVEEDLTHGRRTIAAASIAGVQELM